MVVAHLAQEDGVFQDRPEVGLFLRRLGHARKGREFVHHAADVLHLAYDRVRALVEDSSVFLVYLLTVPAPQPFGRKLDRRQRILDLVRDAAGDVRPGGGTLRDHQIRDVVDGDDVGAVRFVALLRVTWTFSVRSVPPRMMLICLR